MRIGHIIQLVPDALCMLPVVQQLVGACTICAATVEMAAHVGQRIFHGMESSVNEEKLNHFSTIKNAMKKSGGKEKRPDLYNELKANCKVYADRLSNAYIAGCDDNREIAQKLRMIGIGILRMIPIVGTCISIHRFIELRREFYKAENDAFTQAHYGPEQTKRKTPLEEENVSNSDEGSIASSRQSLDEDTLDNSTNSSSFFIN